MFVLAHVSAILKASVLIGNHTNEYVVSVYQGGFNPYDYIMLDWLFPKINTDIAALVPQNTTELM